MLPILFTLGPIKIYTFGVFLVLAFFWGSFFLWQNVRLTSYKEEEIFDGLFISLAGGLFFSRLFYVILNFKEFGFSLLKFILINGYPGLSLYGALFGGILTFFIYCLIKKINFTEIVDYLVSSLFLALAIGKLGAFFSGVEIGTKTRFFLSVKYLGFEGFRHLTGFYEGLFLFFGAYLSYKLLFEIRKEKYKKGFNLMFFFWYFSFIDFLTNNLKENKLLLGKLSFNKAVSLFFLLTITIYFLYYFRVIILKGLVNFFSYVKKNYQKFYRRAKEKIRKRGNKN